MIMTLTPNQEWVLNYLTVNIGRWISPAEIGLKFRLANGSHHSYQTSSNNSAFGSPICLSLVKLDIVSRNTKGKYRIKSTGSVEATGNSTMKEVKPAKTNTAGDKITPIGKANVPPTASESSRLAYNAANGYIRVAVLSNGLELYKKKNEAGRWTYYGESGRAFCMLWDECRATKEEFAIIAKDCYDIAFDLIIKSVEPAGYNYQIGQLIWYFRNNMVHSGKVISRSNPGKNALYETVHGVVGQIAAYASKEALIKDLAIRAEIADLNQIVVILKKFIIDYWDKGKIGMPDIKTWLKMTFNIS